MAEVQIPPIAILRELVNTAADKLREARIAINTLWLLDLGKEVEDIERRLRETSFPTDTGLAPVFIADVPD
jgi:hypothetical protein